MYLDVKWYKRWFYYIPRDLYRDIRKILDFVPLIWSLNEYDYTSPLKLFKYSLERLHTEMNKDRFRSDDIRASQDRLRVAIKLIDDIYINETYLYKYVRILEEEYGKPTVTFKPTNDKIFNPFSNKNENLFTMNYMYINMKKDIEPEEYEKLKMDAYRMGEKMHIKAKKLLWKIIERKIEKWWV